MRPPGLRICRRLHIRSISEIAQTLHRSHKRQPQAPRPKLQVCGHGGACPLTMTRLILMLNAVCASPTLPCATTKRLFAAVEVTFMLWAVRKSRTTPASFCSRRELLVELFHRQELVIVRRALVIHLLDGGIQSRFVVRVQPNGHCNRFGLVFRTHVRRLAGLGGGECRTCRPAPVRQARRRK